ncbi:MAG: TatD family hydrolase [Bacteroidales bacterium]
MYIDTHSHIYGQEYDVDLHQVVSESKESGLEFILMPNVDEESIVSMNRVESLYPGYCIPMMGIHPTSINGDFKNQLSLIRSNLDAKRYCAVGEIGVDLYWSKEFLQEQLLAFETQLRWAKDLGLPVVIHMRDSFDEVLQVVESVGGLKGVFHSFTGTAPQAQRIFNAGDFYLGINGVVTFKNSNLRSELKSIPIEKLVLETDSPYLTPVPNRGKRNHPRNVINVAEALSDIYQVSIEYVAEITTKNAKMIFSLSSKK